MEEFHLYFNGEMTPNYEYPNKKDCAFDVTLYPSFIYASVKLKKKENEQFHFINDCIDSEFVNMLLNINPVYRVMGFIDYHFERFAGERDIFIKHIKYVIVQNIEQRILKADNNANRYKEIEIVIKDWVMKKTKTKEKDNFSTTINNPNNITLNNGTKIKTQNNQTKIGGKTKIALIISLLMLVIAIIANWEKIVKLVSG